VAVAFEWSLRHFKATDKVGCRDALGLSCKGHDSTSPEGVGFWL